MLRAIVMASRLSFRLDRPIVDAIATHRGLMATASPSRLIEEYYKILRSGYAELTFRGLAEHRLLDPVTPEIQRGAKNQALWDQPRRARCLPAQVRSGAGVAPKPGAARLDPDSARTDAAQRAPARSSRSSEEPEEVDGNAIEPSLTSRRAWRRPKFRRPPKEPILKIGMLPIARGDTERLRQMLSLQSRIADLEMSPRAKRSLMHRGPFEDSLTWFEIHGNAPAVLEHWKGFIEALGDEAKHPPAEGEADSRRATAAGRRRRRGRRRRGRRGFKRPPET